MKQENKEKNAPSGIPTRAAGDEPAYSCAYETSGGIIINFHSDEFNQVDELNDCSGNYLTFQTLDGIITSDMRHQMERRCGIDALDRVDATIPLNKVERERNAPAALSAMPPLTVISRGRILIVATDAERARACGKILGEQGLTCTLLVTGKEASGTFSPRFGLLKFLEGNALSMTGTFGCFSATVTAQGIQQPLSEYLGEEESDFDLVLDLQTTPSFAGEHLPIGYYAPGTDPVTLQEMMVELPGMIGRFHRPQFTAFKKDLCLHGRSRARDCIQCIAVCPFGAIQSVAGTISIDHYRCQGCGGCALVCPTEAIQLIQPSQEELLNNLRNRLADKSFDTAFSPTLVISDAETADIQPLPGINDGNHGHRINYEVEQIAHIGLEMLLATLAHGAGLVVVAGGSQNPPSIRKAVEWQVQMGGAILRGLGMREDKIQFVVIPTKDNCSENVTFTAIVTEVHPDKPLRLPATFCFPHDKRTLVRLATQHLYDQSGVKQPGITLPTGSPFGTVSVDPVACTLCMACAVACPSGALFASGDVPRLEFLESRCHQCGLCKESCPEGAIRLLPRMLCDQDTVTTPAVLNEAEPVRCSECGVPFASQAMINRIQVKLAGHWMYPGDSQLRRLHMCRTCRTRDTLVSQDMKSWNQ